MKKALGLALALFISTIVFGQSKNLYPIIVENKLEGYLLVSKYNTSYHTDNFEATVYDENLKVRSNIKTTRPELFFFKSIEFFKDYFVYHFTTKLGKDYVAYTYDGVIINYPAISSFELMEQDNIRRTNAVMVDDLNLLSKSLGNNLLLEQIKPEPLSNFFKIQLRDNRGVIWNQQIAELNSDFSHMIPGLKFVDKTDDYIAVLTNSADLKDPSKKIFFLNTKTGFTLSTLSFKPKENWVDIKVLSDLSTHKGNTLSFFYEESSPRSKKIPVRFEMAKASTTGNIVSSSSFNYLPPAMTEAKGNYDAYVVERNFDSEKPHVVLLVVNNNQFGLVKHYYDFTNGTEKDYQVLGIESEKPVFLKIADPTDADVYITENTDGSKNYLLVRKKGKNNHLYYVALKGDDILQKKYKVDNHSGTVDYYPSVDPASVVEVTLDRQHKSYIFKRRNIENL